ncbi:hypothetical protein DFH08DRAFT_854870 [Mycena albidolilacea]|uniref:Yeast cell wall synthesis Kre9/Knh1-like N-terminal domain-containing protein n=1 Tax=Mycena albidolilacea TaxID=1033008 RepID=A0AAD7ACZ9_9AGAR|nr:hypothetical protein DFH08DRAFT_854870 [Mycena albidolilacea]
MRLPIISSLLTLASAFTLNAPTNPTAGKVTEIHWTFTANDPSNFTLFLLNNPLTDPFSLVAVLGEHLQTNLGEIQTLLPASLPAGDTYELRAVNPENVDFVFASSPIFAIAA